jgi:predicted amidohydrolase YtcJ
MLDERAIGLLAQYGLTVSTQPTFGELWGGEGAMYGERLGVGRARQMLPLAALAASGVAMAFGSDAPAAPLGAWRALRAAVHPHGSEHALSPRAAFAAHTRGGWRSLGDETSGRLVPGARASFALWSAPGEGGRAPSTVGEFLALALSEPGAPEPIWRGTIARGVELWPEAA